MGAYIPIVAQWFYKSAAVAGGAYYSSFGLLGVAPTRAVSAGGSSIMCGMSSSILGG